VVAESAAEDTVEDTVEGSAVENCSAEGVNECNLTSNMNTCRSKVARHLLVTILSVAHLSTRSRVIDMGPFVLLTVLPFLEPFTALATFKVLVIRVDVLDVGHDMITLLRRLAIFVCAIKP
jgi:hypothetical protein